MEPRTKARDVKKALRLERLYIAELSRPSGGPCCQANNDYPQVGSSGAVARA